jgi:hypothetical protein
MTQADQHFSRTNEFQHAGNGRMRRFPRAALYAKEPSIMLGDSST